MKDLAKEVGRTVRAAMRGWPEAPRLCVILAVAAALIAVLQVVTHLTG